MHRTRARLIRSERAHPLVKGTSCLRTFWRLAVIVFETIKSVQVDASMPVDRIMGLRVDRRTLSSLRIREIKMKRNRDGWRLNNQGTHRAPRGSVGFPT